MYMTCTGMIEDMELKAATAAIRDARERGYSDEYIAHAALQAAIAVWMDPEALQAALAARYPDLTTAA